MNILKRFKLLQEKKHNPKIQPRDLAPNIFYKKHISQSDQLFNEQTKSSTLYQSKKHKFNLFLEQL